MSERVEKLVAERLARGSSLYHAREGDLPLRSVSFDSGAIVYQLLGLAPVRFTQLQEATPRDTVPETKTVCASPEEQDAKKRSVTK